jgi:GGDEF domain-containing protein
MCSACHRLCLATLARVVSKETTTPVARPQGKSGRFQARAIAERLRESISSRQFVSGELKLTVTASFGSCTMEGHRAPHLDERLVRLADGALYESKRAGRNRVTEATLQLAASDDGYRT